MHRLKKSLRAYSWEKKIIRQFTKKSKEIEVTTYSGGAGGASAKGARTASTSESGVD